MNEDTHVYCTKCKWFRIDDEDIPYCPFENTCDIGNCEDSMAYKYRPNYEERKWIMVMKDYAHEVLTEIFKYDDKMKLYKFVLELLRQSCLNPNINNEEIELSLLYKLSSKYKFRLIKK